MEDTPDDVLVLVLCALCRSSADYPACLSGVPALVAPSLVCRRWSRVARSDALWSDLYLSDFGPCGPCDPCSPAASPSWRDAYRRRLSRSVALRMAVGGAPREIRGAAPVGIAWIRGWLDPFSHASVRFSAVACALPPRVPRPLFSSYREGLADRDAGRGELLLEHWTAMCQALFRPEADARAETYCSQGRVFLGASFVLSGPKESARKKGRSLGSNEGMLKGCALAADSERRAEASGCRSDPVIALCARLRRHKHWHMVPSCTAYPLYKMARRAFKNVLRGRMAAERGKPLRASWMLIQRQFRSEWLEWFGAPVSYCGSQLLQTASFRWLDANTRGISRIVLAHSGGMDSGGGSVTIDFEEPCSVMRWCMSSFETSPLEGNEVNPEEKFEDGSSVGELDALGHELDKAKEKWDSEKVKGEGYETLESESERMRDSDVCKYSEGDES
eukprot:m51a1_g203 hypothetical protein (447) ;mRNA; r:668803-670249